MFEPIADGSTELRTDVFAVRSFALFAPNSANSEQCEQAKSCEQCEQAKLCEQFTLSEQGEQRTVRTVHIVRTVRTANSANSSFFKNRRTGRRVRTLFGGACSTLLTRKK